MKHLNPREVVGWILLSVLSLFPKGSHWARYVSHHFWPLASSGTGPFLSHFATLSSYRLPVQGAWGRDKASHGCRSSMSFLAWWCSKPVHPGARQCSFSQAYSSAAENHIRSSKMWARIRDWYFNPQVGCGGRSHHQLASRDRAPPTCKRVSLWSGQNGWRGERSHVRSWTLRKLVSSMLEDHVSVMPLGNG